jgi:hypothetical protein
LEDDDDDDDVGLGDDIANKNQTIKALFLIWPVSVKIHEKKNVQAYQ